MNTRTFVAAILLAIIIFVGLTPGFAEETSKPLVIDRTTRNKALNDYALLTRDVIQKSWISPLSAITSSAVKGRIRINYSIDRTGSLVTLKLVKGSNNPEMDRSLLKAIRKAQPFPPFPEGVDTKSLLIRANFIVADLPTVAPIRVSQPVGESGNVFGKPKDAADKKKNYIWGAPAGTSKDMDKAPIEIPGVVSDGILIPANEKIPPRYPSKKYKWGSPK